uniref:Uncharacterized protein n=1 Tax=Zea mays TaxID=4577 RepID=A0A804PF57_MAIZE
MHGRRTRHGVRITIGRRGSHGGRLPPEARAREPESFFTAFPAVFLRGPPWIAAHGAQFPISTTHGGAPGGSGSPVRTGISINSQQQGAQGATVGRAHAGEFASHGRTGNRRASICHDKRTGEACTQSFYSTFSSHSGVGI